MILKRLRLFLLVLITIIWLVFILPYFLVQTTFGSKYVSQFISQYSDHYTITIGRISHSIASPYEITLENIIVQNKAQTTVYFSAQKLVVGLNQHNPLQIHSFNYLLFENGDIELSPALHTIDVQFLQLKNVSVHYLDKQQETEITLKNIYGGAKPWSSQFMASRQDCQFNFTIQHVTYNRLNIHSVFIQGIQQDKTIRLTNLGGDINQGFFTAKAIILPDNSLNINQLKLNNIQFRSAIGDININDLFKDLPYTTIQQLSIINSSISIPNLTIEKGNLEAKNLYYDNGWQLENSDLAFNAQSIIWHDELIEHLLLQWHHENHKIILEQAIGLWNKGSIKLSGSWHNHTLIIDNIIAGGFHYQLPSQWYRSLYTLQLPNIFPPHIIINQFILMPSILIDTDPHLSFQFTSFEAFGQDLEIYSTHQGLNMKGKISVKADNGTLNTVGLITPDLTLDLTSQGHRLTFSTLIEQGILEGEANLLTTKQLQSLILSVHTVDSQVLSLWHLINNPIITDKFTVTLHGQLDPLLLEGELQTDGKNYAIKDGQLINH